MIGNNQNNEKLEKINNEIMSILEKIENKARILKEKRIKITKIEQPDKELFKKYTDMLNNINLIDEEGIDKFIEANIIRLISIILGMKI